MKTTQTMIVLMWPNSNVIKYTVVQRASYMGSNIADSICRPMQCGWVIWVAGVCSIQEPNISGGHMGWPHGPATPQPLHAHSSSPPPPHKNSAQSKLVSLLPPPLARRLLIYCVLFNLGAACRAHAWAASQVLGRAQAAGHLQCK